MCLESFPFVVVVYKEQVFFSDSREVVSSLVDAYGACHDINKGFDFIDVCLCNIIRGLKLCS